MRRPLRVGLVAVTVTALASLGVTAGSGGAVAADRPSALHGLDHVVAGTTASDGSTITAVPYHETFDMTGLTNPGGDYCLGPNTEVTAAGSRTWTVRFPQPMSVRFSVRNGDTGGARVTGELDDPQGKPLSCGDDAPVQANKDYHLRVTWFADADPPVPTNVTLDVVRTPPVGVGVVRGNQWYLATRPGAPASSTFPYGRSTDTPLLMGGTPAVRRGATWYPRGAKSYDYHSAAELPVTGDWNGRDDAASYGTGMYYSAMPGAVAKGVWSLAALRYDGTPYTIKRFSFGRPDDVYVSGDWDGDGVSTPGVFRQGRWFFSNTFGDPATSTCSFGRATDIPVVGDWNGDGTDQPGVFRAGRWYTIDRCGGPVHSFSFGRPGDRPVVGRWH